MTASLYSTVLWRLVRARALARDGDRCSVARLLGGDCSETLHVHHLIPVADGGARYDLSNLVTACSRHHPMLHALRRSVMARLEPRVDEAPRCPHQHRSAEARELCEARLARNRYRHRSLVA